MVFHMENNNQKTNQGETEMETIICSGCERELDLEGLYELAQNDGYTGCCNKSTLTQ